MVAEQSHHTKEYSNWQIGRESIGAEHSINICVENTTFFKNIKYMGLNYTLMPQQTTVKMVSVE